MCSRRFEIISKTVGNLFRLDTRHRGLKSCVVTQNRIKQVHGDEGVTMLSNEPLEGKVALPLPFSRMQQLFMSFDLGLPFVFASILVRQGKPSVSSILRPLERLIDAAYEVALVASSSLLYISELSSVNNTCP
jgi:hypothetical protein